MKPISELIKTPEAGQSVSSTTSTKSQEQTSKPTGLPNSWISALFVKFQARYLHKWTSAIDGIEKIAIAEWSEILAGLTGDQIKRGLDSWDSEWPPTAHEFRQCCEGHTDDHWQHNTVAYRMIDKSKLLPDLGSKEKGRQWLDEIAKQIDATYCVTELDTGLYLTMQSLHAEKADYENKLKMAKGMGNDELVEKIQIVLKSISEKMKALT